MMPFFLNTSSASGVVGPLAPSRMILALMRGRVLGRQHVLERRRHQNVALELERVGAAQDVGGAGKSEKRAGALAVIEDLVFVQPLRVVNRAFALGERDDDRALLAAELRRVIADVAESLHDQPLSVETDRQSERAHVVGRTARLGQGEHQPAAGRFAAAVDAAFGDRLAGDARERLELAGVQLAVRIGDPRHLALAGSVVGRGHVDAGADELLAIELVGVAARDALELLDRVA